MKDVTLFSNINGYALHNSSDLVIGRARKTATQKPSHYNAFNLFNRMPQKIKSKTNIESFVQVVVLLEIQFARFFKNVYKLWFLKISCFYVWVNL